MSQADLSMTGLVGTDPQPFTTKNCEGCSFRLASTRRYRDRHSGQWKDAPTVWITVRAYRTLAKNITASLRKGDPVTVSGRVVMDEWMGEDDRPRTALVLEARAAGHDLAYGVSSFSRLREGQDPVEEVHATGPDGEEAEDFAVPDELAAATAGSADGPQEASPDGTSGSVPDGIGDGTRQDDLEAAKA